MIITSIFSSRFILKKRCCLKGNPKTSFMIAILTDIVRARS
jgi:hypothetical protein